VDQSIFEMKDKTTAYLLWFFLGIWGAHKFYLGKGVMGILYLFTFGFFFIGWAVDLLTLGSQVDVYNALLRPLGNNNNTNQNHIVVNVAQPVSEKIVAHSIAEQIGRLSELKEKGYLTEDEFVNEKVKLLS